jgi:hypothetical protein
MRINTLLLFGLIILGSLGCSEKATDSGNDITIGDLVGTWNATSVVMSNNSNSSEVVDLVLLGATLRFTMLNNGGVRTWFTWDTFSDEWDSQAELTGNGTIKLIPVEASRGVNVYDIVLDNNIVGLTNHNDSFDFTLTGATEVPSTSVATFVRN